MDLDRTLYGTTADYAPYEQEDLVDLRGLVIPPSVGPEDTVQVLVSVRIAEDAGMTGIDGFLVEYEIGGRAHEMRLDNRLWLAPKEGR